MVAPASVNFQNPGQQRSWTQLRKYPCLISTRTCALTRSSVLGHSVDGVRIHFLDVAVLGHSVEQATGACAAWWRAERIGRMSRAKEHGGNNEDKKIREKG